MTLPYHRVLGLGNWTNTDFDADKDCLVTDERDVEEEHREVQGDHHTFSVLRKVANSISPMLQWTSDVPSNHSNNKVPCLDIQISKDVKDVENKIKFEFYKKQVSRSTLITRNSALPSSTKFSVLVSEGTRRLKNTIPCLVEEQKPRLLREFNYWMRESGHSRDFRYRVTERVLSLYQSWVNKEMAGDTPLYRNKSEIYLSRKSKSEKL